MPFFILAAIGAIFYDPIRKNWRNNGDDAKSVWLPRPTGQNHNSQYKGRSEKIVLLPQSIETSCASGCSCDITLITPNPYNPSETANQTFFCKNIYPEVYSKETWFGQVCEVSMEIGSGLHNCNTRRIDDPGNQEITGNMDAVEELDKPRKLGKLANTPNIFKKAAALPVKFFNSMGGAQPIHGTVALVKNPQKGYRATPKGQTIVLAEERKLRIICVDDCKCSIELWRAATPFVDDKPDMLAGYRCGRETTFSKSRDAVWAESRGAGSPIPEDLKTHCQVSYSLDRGLEKCESTFVHRNDKVLDQFLFEQKMATDLDQQVVIALKRRNHITIAQTPYVPPEIIPTYPSDDKPITTEIPDIKDAINLIQKELTFENLPSYPMPENFHPRWLRRQIRSPSQEYSRDPPYMIIPD